MHHRLIFVLLTLFFLVASPLTFADNTIWLDVRSPEEYSANHISLAYNIPHMDIAQRINEVARDKDTPIYVYCRSGRRSGIAKMTLDEMGFTNVENLGGFQQAQHTAVLMNVCPHADTSDC